MYFEKNSIIFILTLFILEIQTEDGESESSHGRQKRFIYLPTGPNTPLNIGFIFTIPLSFVIPQLSEKTSARFTRSLDQDEMTQNDILPIDSYDDPAYALELDKLSIYFNALEVDEDVCQQKILCEMFTEPDNYRPLSDLVSQKLTVDHGIMQETMSSRYYRYVMAMENGILGRECQILYSRCPYSVQHRVEMQAMKFWSFLISICPIEFHD